MKHGDKEKGKSAKAVSKTSGKKGAQAGAKVSAAGKSSVKAKAPAKTGKVESSPAAKKQVASKEEGGNGSSKARAPEAGSSGGFTNPAVAAGYKRALKKYPNAFRKLTD